MVDTNSTSEEKIRKATEYLWKFWWFTFYLIIAPLIISLIIYFVFILFPLEHSVVFTIAVIAYLMSAIFFYKAFDKYREKSFFLNAENNLNARIHIIFLFTVISLVITPIAYISTLESISFNVLPLISFILIGALTFYYYKFHPIDFFDKTKGKFKHFTTYSKVFIQPHNFTVIIYYIVHIVFLSITIFVPFSWLVALILNIIFYFISLKTTKSYREKVLANLKSNLSVVKDLFLFKKYMVNNLFTLLYVLLIACPISLLINFGLNFTHSNFILLSVIFLPITFLIFNFKTRFYIYFYYSHLVSNLVNPSSTSSELNFVEKLKYQKYNSILSLVLIGMLSLYISLIGLPLLVFLVFVLFYIIPYFEQKAEYSRKKDTRIIFLINSVTCLSIVSFLLLPSIWSIISWNIQFLIFFISLYFCLELFAKQSYFDKDEIRVVQNILALLSFFFFAFLFYPLIAIGNAFYDILLFALICLIISITSFYVLFLRYFYGRNRVKSFKICIILNFTAIEVFWFTLFYLGLYNYDILELGFFLTTLILTLNLLPIIFILFLFLNYTIGIFKYKEFLAYRYYSSWVLILSLFFSMLFAFYYNFVLILIVLIFFSILLQFQFKFGLKLIKIKESFFNKFQTFNIYLVSVESFFLLYLIFVYFLDILISVYLSLVIICVIINIFVAAEFFFSKTSSIYLNIVCLFFTSVIIFYYLLIFSLGTYYSLIVPLIFTSISLFFPLIYTFRNDLYPNIIRKIIAINGIILAIALSLIPTIVGLELYNILINVDIMLFIMTIVNSTMYILYSILVFTYMLSKTFKFSENLKDLFLMLQVFIEIVLTFTTVFFYLFYFIPGLYYQIFFPILAASCFFYLPSVFAYNKSYFNRKLVKKTIFGNSLLLAGCVTLIPSIIGLELARQYILLNVFVYIIFTAFIIFGMLKFLEYLANWLKMNENKVITIKFGEIVTWFFISLSVFMLILTGFPVYGFDVLLLLRIAMAFLAFFSINLYSLVQLEVVRRRIFTNEGSRFNSFKVQDILNYFQSIVIYGIIVSLSFIIVNSLQLGGIFSLLPADLAIWTYIFEIGLFFSLSLLFLLLTNYIVKLEFYRAKQIIELCFYVLLKCIICLLLILFPFPLSVVNRVFLVVLVISCLNPITLLFFRRVYAINDQTQLKIIKYTVYLFIFSAYSLYIELFLFFSSMDSLFKDNIIILAVVLSSNLILTSKLTYPALKNSEEVNTTNKIYRFYGLSCVLFVSLIYIFPIISIFILMPGAYVILSKRNKNYPLRFLYYFTLSFVFFIDIFALIKDLFIYTILGSVYIGILILLYFSLLISVLFCSIIINYKHPNKIEVLSVIISVSLLSFTFLITFTNILILYNVAISVLINLLLTGMYYYYIKDSRYKWFIKPAILLIVFNLTSWISYSFLFINPAYTLYNPFLTLTLTVGITCFGFVILFNKISEQLRTRTYLITLTGLIFSIPLIVYFLLISYIGFPITDPLTYIIAINIGIILFYLSIGIYQWKVSWAIWRAGWWLWIIFPFVNFYVLYKSFEGIDLFTNALTLFGFLDIEGSIIIALLICSSLYLPIIYTKVKKYFTQIIFTIWGESLVLLYWISQNVFIENIILIWLSFVVFAVILLVPILYVFKFWKWLSLSWLVLTGFNVSFMLILLVSLGISYVGFLISIGVLMTGMFLLVFSFFPSIRTQPLVLVSAYITVLSSVFLLIFSLILLIILNPLISANLAFISIALLGFSSKFLKLNKRVTHFLISWTLIINTSLLTLFSFWLIPNLQWFAVFFSIAIFGVSLFIFNRFEMRLLTIKTSSIILISIGLSSSIFALLAVVIPLNPFIIWSIFIAINLAFLYFILDKQRQYLWYLIPISIALALLELVVLIDIISSFVLLTILSYIILYLSSLLIIVNLVNNLYTGKKEEQEKENALMFFYEDKEKIKILNLTCFLFISTYASLFVTLVSPISLIYQLLEFLMFWSVLTLISLNYIKMARIDIKNESLIVTLGKFKSLLFTSLYFEVTLTIYLFLIEIGLFGILETFIIPLVILFGLIQLDIYAIKKNKSLYSYSISWKLNAILSILIFLYLYQFSVILIDLIWLNIILLLSMQFYTIYAIFTAFKLIYPFKIGKLENLKRNIQNIVINSIFFVVCIYSSALITNFIGTLFPLLPGFQIILLNITLFLLFFFLLNIFFNRTLIIRHRLMILLPVYWIFQVFLAICWFSFILVFEVLNTLSISLIILIETLLSFYTFYTNHILYSSKRTLILKKRAFSLTIFGVYLELSVLFFGLSILYLGLFESILLSQIALFLITVLDMGYARLIQKRYVQIVHTISFLNIIWTLFVLLNTLLLVNSDFIFFNLIFLNFLLFYLHYSIFATLNAFYPEKKLTLNKWNLKSRQIIAFSFYIILIISIQRLLAPIEINLQLLLLGLITHGIVILDQMFLNFLGELSKYVRAFSWIFVMIFSWSLLFILSYMYIIPFYFILFPLFILVLMVEFAYLVKLLQFWQWIVVNRKKIKNTLISIVYLDSISYPLYFSYLHLIMVLHMLILSFMILIGISFIDDYVKLVKQKVRSTIRTYSFLSSGIVLSIDIFIILQFYIQPALALTLNLSIVLLIFILFLSIIVKPFKRHSFKSFIFWALIFGLLASIIYHIYQSYIITGALFAIAILVYPFIFLLEEIKELFSKFVDVLTIFIRNIKQLIVNFFSMIVNFLKRNFMCIWTVITCMISITIFVLIITFLAWYHALLISAGVGAFLLSAILSSKEELEDVNKTFRRRIITLIALWSIIIGVLFSFISLEFYILAIFLSILVFGAIILPYIYFKEKRENISIKWRFYTTLFFIFIIVITGVLLYLQLSAILI